MKHQIQQCIVLAMLCTNASAYANDYPKTDVSANIKIDFDKFDKVFIENGNETEDKLYLRRLRLGIKSEFTKNWLARVKVDLEDDIEVVDAYLKYDGWKYADFTLGKQKEPFGLERLMSTNDLPLIERSMMSNALSPNRSTGIKISGGKKTLHWQLGYFTDNEDHQGSALTARLAWGIKNKGNDVLHIAGSYSERDLAGQSFRINERLEINQADSLVEGQRFNAESSSVVGVEFVSQYRGLLAMAEWQQSSMTTDTDGEYQYNAGYLQVSYLLSGKNKKYKHGMLDGAKTKDDWEFALRYSTLSLQQENSEAQVVSAGINYLYSKNLQVRANIVNAKYLEQGLDLGSGNAIALRFVYRF